MHGGASAGPRWAATPAAPRAPCRRRWGRWLAATQCHAQPQGSLQHDGRFQPRPQGTTWCKLAKVVRIVGRTKGQSKEAYMQQLTAQRAALAEQAPSQLGANSERRLFGAGPSIWSQGRASLVTHDSWADKHSAPKAGAHLSSSSRREGLPGAGRHAVRQPQLCADRGAHPRPRRHQPSRRRQPPARTRGVCAGRG